MPAKTEGIAKYGVYFPALSFIKCEIELWIELIVVREMVDCWRY